TFGGPGFRRSGPDFMAGYIVNLILGAGGLSSRLYREVREKRGLAYSIYESLLWMERSALFIGNTGTRADRAGETVDAIEKEVRRIAEEGPTEKELDEAKSYLKGSQMLALDTSSKLAQAMLQYQLDKLPIDYIEKRNALVDAVTLDDARKAARRLWGQGLLTVIVGRAPQAAAQLKRLAGQRTTKDGVIVIHAQRFRTQERNRADAIDRLLELLREAMVRPVPRRATKPTFGSKQRRLEGKKHRSDVKAKRGNRFDD